MDFELNILALKGALKAGYMHEFVYWDFCNIWKLVQFYSKYFEIIKAIIKYNILYGKPFFYYS